MGKNTGSAELEQGCGTHYHIRAGRGPTGRMVIELPGPHLTSPFGVDPLKRACVWTLRRAKGTEYTALRTLYRSSRRAIRGRRLEVIVSAIIRSRQLQALRPSQSATDICVSLCPAAISENEIAGPTTFETLVERGRGA